METKETNAKKETNVKSKDTEKKERKKIEKAKAKAEKLSRIEIIPFKEDKHFCMMRYDIMDYILFNCGSTAYVIYTMLLRCRSSVSGACFPSLKKLHEMSGIAKSNIQNAIEILVDFGVIEYKRGYFGQTGKNSKSNSYILLLEENKGNVVTQQPNHKKTKAYLNEKAKKELQETLENEKLNQINNKKTANTVLQNHISQKKNKLDNYNKDDEDDDTQPF